MAGVQSQCERNNGTGVRAGQQLEEAGDLQQKGEGVLGSQHEREAICGGVQLIKRHLALEETSLIMIVSYNYNHMHLKAKQ